MKLGIIFLLALSNHIFQVETLQTEAAKKLSNQARSDGYLVSMFEVVLTTMESKLRRVENLDRAVQQLMLKLDTMDRRTNSQSDTILAKLDVISKSAEQTDAILEKLSKTVVHLDTVQSKLDKLDSLCPGKGRKLDEEDDLVAEPSERQARFWNPAAQIAQSSHMVQVALHSQNTQIAQNAQLARNSRLARNPDLVADVPVPVAVVQPHEAIAPSQAVQNSNAAGFRRRRLIRKTGHSTSAESLSDNLSPASIDIPLPPPPVATILNSNSNSNSNSNNNSNSNKDMEQVKDAVTDLDRRLESHIDLVVENLGKVSQMMKEVHTALMDDSVTEDEASSNATAVTHKRTKLDMLLTKIRPLMGVNQKMDEVKDMLDGTKTSVEHLLPKSDEIFNQTQRQGRAISNIHTDLNEKTNAIMKELTEVERELSQTKLNFNSIYSISGTRKADNIPAEIFEQNLARDFPGPDIEEDLVHGVFRTPLPTSTASTTASTKTTTTAPVATAPLTPLALVSGLPLENSTANKMRMRSSTAWIETTTTATTSITTTKTTTPSNTTTTKTTLMLVNVTSPSPTTSTTSKNVSLHNMTSTPTTTTAKSVTNTNSTTTAAAAAQNTTNSSNVTSNFDFSLVNNTINHESATISCADLKKKDPTSESGVFYLQINGNKYRFLKVFCDMEASGGGWTVIQRREDFGEDLRENFNRGWEDYKFGFGDPDHEFWMGNENIYMLTRNDDYELRVELDDFDGNRRYAEYKHFKLGSEEDDYRLEIGGYLGNAGDSLNDPWYGSNQRPFSTFDRDNDRSSLNCASMLKGGWWWKSCGRGLNGVYLTNPQDLAARQGIVWFRWRGWDYTLKRSRMMIRPKNFTVNEEKEIEK